MFGAFKRMWKSMRNKREKRKEQANASMKNDSKNPKSKTELLKDALHKQSLDISNRKTRAEAALKHETKYYNDFIKSLEGKEKSKVDYDTETGLEEAKKYHSEQIKDLEKQLKANKEQYAKLQENSTSNNLKPTSTPSAGKKSRWKRFMRGGR